LIETPRLLLGPLRDEDVEALWEIQGDPQAMRFTSVAPSREECARRLRTHEGLRAETGFAPWVAVLREDGRVVGWGGLGIDPFEPGWGVEVALPAIGAFARPENTASTRVLEKCGFRLLGWEPALARNHCEIVRGGLG
jgi:ribosomal-protein-alanine N-acetyltransferase